MGPASALLAIRTLLRNPPIPVDMRSSLSAWLKGIIDIANTVTIPIEQGVGPLLPLRTGHASKTKQDEARHDPLTSGRCRAGRVAESGIGEAPAPFDTKKRRKNASPPLAPELFISNP